MRKNIVYLTRDIREVREFRVKFADSLLFQHFDNPVSFLSWLNLGNPFDAVFLTASPTSPLGLNLIRTLKQDRKLTQPIFWLTDSNLLPDLKKLHLEAGVSDILGKDLTDPDQFLNRLHYFLDKKVVTARSPQLVPAFDYLRFGKRLFDLVLATTLLIFLSPLFLVIAALIRLESKGPAFYYAPRVGTGYRIFKFWKFRSMRQDADQLLSSVKNLNQYQAALVPGPGQAPGHLCSGCAFSQVCSHKLIDGGGKFICEKQYRQTNLMQASPAFIKVANDPRITRIGHFIRKTSIDELPQLFNVLCGDMSIVGNRPLPLYEAEKLTTDEFADRFNAPAGITGLWQVTKRGQANMSERERINLDIDYARRFSFKEDIRILMKTFPALYQKENV